MTKLIVSDLTGVWSRIRDSYLPRWFENRLYQALGRVSDRWLGEHSRRGIYAEGEHRGL